MPQSLSIDSLPKKIHNFPEIFLRHINFRVKICEARKLLPSESEEEIQIQLLGSIA